MLHLAVPTRVVDVHILTLQSAASHDLLWLGVGSDAKKLRFETDDHSHVRCRLNKEQLKRCVKHLSLSLKKSVTKNRLMES